MFFTFKILLVWPGMTFIKCAFLDLGWRFKNTISSLYMDGMSFIRLFSHSLDIFMTTPTQSILILISHRLTNGKSWLTFLRQFLIYHRQVLTDI